MVNLQETLQNLTDAINNYYEPFLYTKGFLSIENNLYQPYFYRNRSIDRKNEKELYFYFSEKSFLELDMKGFLNQRKIPVQSKPKNKNNKHMKNIFIIIPNNMTGHEIRNNSPFRQTSKKFYMNAQDLSIFEANETGIHHYYCFFKESIYISEKKSQFLLKSKSQDWKNDIIFANDFHEHCNRNNFNFSLEDIINDIDGCIEHINLIEY